MKPHNRLLVAILPILVVNWFIMALVEPEGPKAWEYVGLGNLIGSCFAHPTLAAAWCAWGPGSLRWRLPLSLLWVATVPLGLGLNVGMHGGGPDDVIFTIGACVLAQWLLVQAPLWCIAVMFGVALRQRGEFSAPLQAKDLQFGIRQLLILTAIVAVVLGSGRLLLAWLGTRFDGMSGDTPIFIFLAVAAVAMTLPLLIAALLPQYAVPATLGVLVVIALATCGEYPLERMMTGSRGGGPDVWHFAWINAFQAFWVLAVVIAVRACGYGLAPRAARSPFAPS